MMTFLEMTVIKLGTVLQGIYMMAEDNRYRELKSSLNLIIIKMTRFTLFEKKFFFNIISIPSYLKHPFS